MKKKDKEKGGDCQRIHLAVITLNLKKGYLQTTRQFKGAPGVFALKSQRGNSRRQLFEVWKRRRTSSFRKHDM